MKTLRWSLTLLLLSACAPDEANLDIGTTESAVAPAGSNASFIANTVPTVLSPGERVNVSVTAQNDGAASPANDWTVNQYSLNQQNATFAAAAPRVLTNTPPTNQYNFRTVIRAPQTPGPHTFAVRNFSLVPGQTGYFGPTLSIPGITTDPNQRPNWRCTLNTHDVPATMTPDEVRTVNITVVNSGTQDWAVNGHCLFSRNSPTALFGQPTCPRNNATVVGSPQGTPLGTGISHTFTFNIRAPATPGNYTFSRQMFQLGAWTQGSVGFYETATNCVDIPITVAAGGVPYDAAFNAAGSNIPATMAPGETVEVTVRMDNTGTQTWPGNGTVQNGQTMLYTRNTPSTLWGPNTINPTPAPVAPAASGDYTFAITAPVVGMPTDFNFNWRMFGSPAGGFYGETTPVVINVDPAAPLNYDAAVVAEVYPVVSPLRPETFRITMQNTGTQTWTAGQYRLQSTNTPVGLWGITSVNLPQNVAPGNSYQFVFSIQGPQNPGMYNSRWRMSHPNPDIGLFGAETTGTVTVTADCGDLVVDVGEQCDDGNTVGGDGCSAGCQLERSVFDLAVENADRTFTTAPGSRNLDRVGIGDVNNDGTPDLVMGLKGLPAPATYRAGAIFVHTAGPGFFNSTATDVATGGYLRINGARANDFLSGGVHGRIAVGDVTGDGIDDIVATAENGACATGMDQCGRAYVIRGGAGLNAVPGGVLDLATPTADVIAQITAPTDGDRLSVIAIGELTGDAFNDIVFGLPNANATAGRVVVVAGGPALTSMDLTFANVFAEMNGLGVGDLLGRVATIGDISGDGAPDLIISSPSFDQSATNAGGVWALFGPLTSGTSYNLATQFSVRWFGNGSGDAYGTALATGDVTGNADNDLIIGGEATRFAPNTRYGAVDFWAGPLAGGSTFDLSLGSIPTQRTQGVDPADGFGHCVGVAEFTNVNQGNKADVLVTATFSQGNGNAFTHAGETHLIMGDEAGLNVQLDPNSTISSIYGPATAARPCYYYGSMAIGDLDSDGDPDYCLGTLGASGAAGRVDCVENAWQ